MRLMSSSARLNYSDWFRRLIVMPNKPPYLDKAIALVPVSWLENSEFVKRRTLEASQVNHYNRVESCMVLKDRPTPPPSI